MINPGKLYDLLSKYQITFYTGVPDSLLKDFCSYVTDNTPEENHIINSNEGAAVALASGYYISTGKPALVYMQNSGLGNSVNPLLSLADSEVYGIPMILMIGWRGEPGKKDEPQHLKQGRVMIDMIKSMEIPFKIINKDTTDIDKIVKDISETLKEKPAPFALVVSEGTFEKYNMKNESPEIYSLNREEALSIILKNLNEKDIIVTTTGKTSREVYEFRTNNNQSHKNDFLTVGSMGHCSQIALGISIQKKDKQIFAIDGDGAMIMHLGSSAVIGTNARCNYRHILINNGSHDSVGGQPTAGFKINFNQISEACGYKYSSSAETAEQIEKEIKNLKSCEGPAFLEIKVNKGSRINLGRPSTSPRENKKLFMDFLSQ